MKTKVFQHVPRINISIGHLTFDISHMGQKLQDGKKVLEMSQLHPHSNSRHFQTIHPTDLGLLPSWKSIVGAPTQEFSPSWGARKRVQEIVEIS